MNTETYVMCEHCYATFPSPIDFNSSIAFELLEMKPTAITCPACGKTTIATKKLMIFKET